jgi:hypothetical protein
MPPGQQSGTAYYVFTKVRTNPLFYFGIIVFLMAKLYLVILPAYSLSIPRLGDDSLVYLWRGKLSSFDYSTSSPSLQDILVQRYLDDSPPEQIGMIRSEVAARNIGTLAPVYDYMMRLLLATGLSLKWAFAVSEIIGVITMTFAFAIFLRLLVGSAPAGIGMLLLAFAILPYQGIYSFIPSTWSLSLSMLLWTYMLKSRTAASPLLVFVVSLFILGVHPVARVYVSAAAALHIIGLSNIKLAFQRRMLLLYSSIIAALLLSLVLPRAIPSLSPPPSSILGEIRIDESILENLRAVWPLIKDPLIRKNILLALLFVFALVLRPKEMFLSRIVILTVILIFSLMAISLIFYMPGHPAELFTRLLVPFVVIIAGIGSKFLLVQIERGKYKRIKLSLFILCLLASFSLWTGSYVFQTMNWRTEVVHDDLLRKQLDSLPTHTDILYADAFIALQASLLQEGYRYGAIVYPMLKNSYSLDAFLNTRKPEVIVIPNFRSLNSLAANRVKNFKSRRHGFNFKATDYIIIESLEGKTVSSLYLFINNSSDNAILTTQVFSINHGSGFSESKISVQPKFKGWLKVLEQTYGVKTVRIVLPEQNGWVEGIATEPPQPHIYWPWNSEVTVTYHMRKKPAEKVVKIQFSPEKLLSEYDAADLIDVIAKGSPVISDDSGLVFMRTVYADNKAKN